MNVLILMIPIALFLGGMGLCAFLWALRSGQYDDINGAEHRMLADD
ncbi:cbb3-type cytochrome oxidase assembly protein CcoS [Methylobacterium nodulans]|uniref:Cytochrome oxidase maturation protein, cbb3-type n=1 Tax=Methylobacterium nodulans (strain LMG 21967 / CNCM I-2342 / ORS 2060) TaxID=460265 RepID=B8IN85_METNO|nr:cbb3-type cytochrome oxidase assembly protein CcoS [Methylobacterium nodulans]ACL62201.1 cytochrome oxidase maturation protein, cbb3-type [Methylobacterium nodulans ORS 2060]